MRVVNIGDSNAEPRLMKSVSVLGNEILEQVRAILADLNSPSFTAVEVRDPGSSLLCRKTVDIPLGDSGDSIVISLYQRVSGEK